MGRLGALLVVLLLTLLPSPASSQTVRYADTLAVYDSLGRKVANVDWFDPWFEVVEVVVRLGSRRPFLLTLGAPGWISEGVGFTSGDCTGQPFVRSREYFGGAVGPWAAVAGPRATLYSPVGPFAPGPMTSRLTVEGVCEVPPGGYRGAFAPARAELDLADYFVPPFTLRARGDAVPE